MPRRSWRLPYDDQDDEDLDRINKTIDLLAYEDLDDLFFEMEDIELEWEEAEDLPDPEEKASK